MKTEFAIALLAMAVLSVCAAAQENTTEYWMNKAEELAHNGSIDGAISAYNEVLKIDPGNETALIHKASELNVLGNLNESSVAYQKALALLDEDLKANPNDAEAWQWKASVLNSLNRGEEATQAYKKALDAFNQRIEKNPLDADSLRRKAHVLMTLGRYDDARKAYDEATDANPQDYNVWWDKGQFLSADGDINESMEAYDRAIGLIPANDTAELVLALSDKAEELAFTSRWEDALNATDRAIELDPKNSVIWHFKAFILTSLDRKEESLEAFDGAIKQNPDDAIAWQYKASQLLEMKRYNESLEAYDRVINLTGENDTAGLAQAYLSKGIALNKTGRTDDARETLQKSLDLYDRALQENPGDFSLMEPKGRALLNLGRYGDAVQVYDQIIDSSPKIQPYLTDTAAWIGKGDALQALGRNQDALFAYNKAIETGPNFGNAWKGRGDAQRSLGQVYNASISYYVAQELGYQG
jgi:tetratricopeptide (TPR) repeat protein